jgi:hypothetical protein
LCFLCATARTAVAQSTTPPTATEKFLGRFDLAISADGIFSTSVSGTEKRDVLPLTVEPSNTVGELGTLRYVVKPYVGFEFNFGNSRYTQNFISPLNFLPGGAQANVHEETLGYVAHPRLSLLGLKPFLGAGGGTMRFKPTPYGGQGLPQQYRAVYFYDLGVDDTIAGDHLGIRLGFRQLIYLAPDFGQNYLTITRRARTSEPTIGLFLRF